MNLRIRKALFLAAITLGLFVLPAAAQAATQHITWKTTDRLEAVSKDGFAGVSCPSAGECVSVDESGRVVYTTKPKTAGSWKFASVDSGRAMSGISCPTTKFCVAIDQSGFEVHSSDPTGGAKQWSKPVRIDTTKLAGGAYAGLAGIHCPSAKLCIAVDNSTSAGVLYTTDPAGGASDWHRISLGSGVILDAVHCTSTTECVVGGSRAFYSTDPAGGKADWHASGSFSGSFMQALSCPTATLCVGAGYSGSDQGIAFTSTKPTASGWTRSNVEPQIPGPNMGTFDAIACANSGFCIAIDSNDRAYTTTHPAKHEWTATATAIRKNAVASRSVITCHGDLCVAMDSRGVEETGTVSG